MKTGIAFSEFLFSMPFFMCRCQNDDRKDKSAVRDSIYLGGAVCREEGERMGENRTLRNALHCRGALILAWMM